MENESSVKQPQTTSFWMAYILLLDALAIQAFSREYMHIAQHPPLYNV